MGLSKDEVLEILDKFQANVKPNAKDLEKPKYYLYVLAPYLFTHQITCLLAGITTIDRETFEAVLSFNGLKLKRKG